MHNQTPSNEIKEIKITGEINGIENRNSTQQINEPKSEFHEKINKTNKSLVRLTERKC